MVRIHVERDLLRYVERELPPEARRQVEAHLRACPECRAALADLLDLTDALKSAPAAFRPFLRRIEAQWPAVWQRVRRRPARARSGWQLATSLAVAATFFMLANWPLATAYRLGPTGAAEVAPVSWAGLPTPLAPVSTGPASAAEAATSPGFAATLDLMPAPVPVPTPIPVPAS